MVGDRYAWPTIARRTAMTYRSAIRQAPGFDSGEAATILATAARPRIVVPEGNLLAVT
jgi:glycogen(starch) synthase